MNEFDLLIAYLGAAVAFLGFTGIVAQFERRAVRESPQAISFRIRVVAGLSIILTGVAVLPSLILAFGISPALAWPWACGLGGAILAINLAVIVQGTRRLTESGRRERFPISATYIQIQNALALMGLAVTVAGAAGLLPAVGCYLVFATFYLMTLSVAFLRLVLMLESSLRDED